MAEVEYEYAIDGGTVSFEDGLKASEEYAPARKVRVELHFSVAEGERNSAAVAARVGDLCRSEVSRLLTGAAPAALKVVGGTDIDQTPATTRTRRTKAQIEADKAAAGTKDPAAVDEDPTAGQEPVIHLPDASDPAGMDEFDGPSKTGGDGVAQTSADPAGMDDWEVGGTPAVEEAPVVTDADLNSAVQKRNAELAAPNLIRELIGAYNPDPSKPFQLRQIPADKRAEFLTKLGALKKPAA